MICQYLYRITPYWLVHAVISILLSWATGIWFLGGLIYVVRELTQYEEKNDFDWLQFKSRSKEKVKFDWTGLVIPVLVSIIYLIIKTGK